MSDSRMAVALWAMVAMTAISGCASGDPDRPGEGAAREAAIAAGGMDGAPPSRMMPADMPKALREVCEAAASAMDGVPGGDVSREESMAPPRCRVSVRGTFAALRGATPPEERLFAVLAARGGVRDPHYDADGPDGTSALFRSRDFRCLVSGRWDGGDDSDPDDVPEDRYEVRLECVEEREDPDGG